MGIVKEFKEFAVKGNVVDLAVAVIIGGAFGAIVSSFVNDIIMPPLGLLLGNVDFTDLKWVLRDAYIEPDGTELGAVSINYGTFLQFLVDFLIVALVIFLAVRALNSMKKKEIAKPTVFPAPSKEEILLTEIRDILKNQQGPSRL